MVMEIGNLSFFEKEEEDVDNQRRREFLTSFMPESVKALSALQDKQLEEHDQTLNFPLIVDDDVDTTLTLSTGVSRNSASPVYDPTPLRSSTPTNLPEGCNINSLASLSLGPPLLSNKRKREGNGGKRGGKRSSNGDDGEDPRPLTPVVAQALEEKGATPVFLYRKKLEGSDVKPELNRLFVAKREQLFEFLTAEEAAAIDAGGGGINVLGVDECGKPYDLAVRKWRGLNMTVIVSDWSKLAAANTAGKGDSVEIWGFRLDGKLGFAITFRSS